MQVKIITVETTNNGLAEEYIGYIGQASHQDAEGRRWMVEAAFKVGSKFIIRLVPQPAGYQIPGDHTLMRDIMSNIEDYYLRRWPGKTTPDPFRIVEEPERLQLMWRWVTHERQSRGPQAFACRPWNDDGSARVSGTDNFINFSELIRRLKVKPQFVLDFFRPHFHEILVSTELSDRLYAEARASIQPLQISSYSHQWGYLAYENYIVCPH